MHTIDCEKCGNSFKVYPYQLGKRKYCSRKCADLAMVRRVSITCETCEETFEVKPNQVKKRRYCSPECAHESFKNREVRPCVICGTEIERPKSLFYENAVCSDECDRKHISQRLQGEKHFNYNSVIKSCLVCGISYAVPVSRDEVGKGKFCSKSCKYKFFSEHFSETRNPNWKGGHRDYRGPNWSTQRMKALSRDKHTCQRCGDSRKLLHVHHIKPYRDFGGDYERANELSNLVSLCASCHSHVEPRVKIAR